MSTTNRTGLDLLVLVPPSENENASGNRKESGLELGSIHPVDIRD